MFLQNVCCAIRAWLPVWVHGCLPFCILASICVCTVAACVRVWLEILSMLYYTGDQKTQRLIREAYQTLALSGIDSLSLGPVNHSCPGCLLLPTMLNFPTTHHTHFVWLLVIISNNLNLIWQSLFLEGYWSHPEWDAIRNLVLFFYLSLHHLPSNQVAFTSNRLADRTLSC